MAVGINAIEAVLEGNPHFRQVRGFTELTDNLYKARDTIRARELADFICSRDSTSQQQQDRMEVSETQQQLLPGKGVSKILPISQRLAFLETVTLSTASAEAGIQPSVVSGPLETKKPAQPVSPGNSAGPSQQSISAESLSELTQPPPSCAGSFSEVIQPAEDFTLLSLPGQSQGRHIHTQHGLVVHVQHLTIAGHLPGCRLDIFAVMGDLLNCSIADVLHAASLGICLTNAATVFHTVGIWICATHTVAGSGVGPLNCVLDSGDSAS
ncbi:RNA polymerase I-specific transcription initiation factor RRN3 [Sarotherodon galilaeus]